MPLGLAAFKHTKVHILYKNITDVEGETVTIVWLFYSTVPVNDFVCSFVVCLHALVGDSKSVQVPAKVF